MFLGSKVRSGESARAPLRVAFTHIPRQLWAGGYNYQSNLFAALTGFVRVKLRPSCLREQWG